jgi:tetratricopeptide (TPR) repeat protein
MSRRREARARLALLAATALLVSGCAAQGHAQRNFAVPGLPQRVELDDTPFIAQRAYQCGPAALATVLLASGVPVGADELAVEVYLPARKGSLQAEIIAATRQRDRLAYMVTPSLASLLAQVASGHPVLVLQRTGFGAWPGWHYAVVAGYDLDEGRLLLRSGTEPRLELSFDRFMATWNRAARWAMVAVEPGTLPADADLQRYMQAASELEAVGRGASAGKAYRAAASAWPEEALPRVGLANLAYSAGDFTSAERELRAAIQRTPSDAVLRNNRAIALHAMGCSASARLEAETARAIATGGPHEAEVEETIRAIDRVEATDAPGCPPPERWAHSPP